MITIYSREYLGSANAHHLQVNYMKLSDGLKRNLRMVSNKRAGEDLQRLYPQLEHITCVPEGPNITTDLALNNLPPSNKLIAELKKTFLKAGHIYSREDLGSANESCLGMFCNLLPKFLLMCIPSIGYQVKEQRRLFQLITNNLSEKTHLKTLEDHLPHEYFNPSNSSVNSPSLVLDLARRDGHPSRLQSMTMGHLKDQLRSPKNNNYLSYSEQEDNRLSGIKANPFLKRKKKKKQKIVTKIQPPKINSPFMKWMPRPKYEDLLSDYRDNGYRKNNEDAKITRTVSVVTYFKRIPFRPSPYLGRIPSKKNPLGIRDRHYFISSLFLPQNVILMSNNK
ncbi:unnamed protein product [Lepeophtheirus salmonis]|uniref:(salmon louse) hypothetical protein n=1 Tax=Lepeophtheirus salmonis TaxID=72036 RepID=A0A7R8CF77_LEPSM|nr:unnamed protein product [Lepeophtheirus salmonis]CAF2804047.1 unnamed protein product [Lepeophtheirus salmonis]